MSDQDTTHLKRKTEHPRGELADRLESLAAQIRSGHLTFEGESLTLDLPEQLHLSLECKDSPKPEGLKHELELEIWWMDHN